MTIHIKINDYISLCIIISIIVLNFSSPVFCQLVDTITTNPNCNFNKYNSPLKINCNDSLSNVLLHLKENTYFTESQNALGIDHIHRHENFLGGGVAIFDLENDGDNDIYLTGGSDQDRLFVNDGEGNFVDQSTNLGLFITKLYYTNGVIVGDVDNDGLKDIFVTTTGNIQEKYGKNLLFHQQTDGTFIEKWGPYEPKDKTQAMGATFIDFNQDGLLDIYIVSYVESVAFLYDDSNNIVGYDHECFENRLYMNTGSPENFLDVTDIIDMSDSGCSLATFSTDYNKDGWLDIVTANDFGEFVLPSTLLEFNTIDSNFIDVSFEKRADFKMYGMGISSSDYDHDLDMDYYVTNIGKNVLMNNDNFVFENTAEFAQIEDEWILSDSISAVSWGASFIDFDNDSFDDLFVADGYIPTPSFLSTTLWNPDRLYKNNGDGTFAEIDSLLSGINNRFTSRGSAIGDIDGDGDLDIISAVISVPQNLGTWQTKIYKNNLSNANNWVQLDLAGILANKDAIGSKIYLYKNDDVLLTEIAGSSSHCSHDSDIVHFGLGEATSIDSVAIEWPSRSKKQWLYDLGINQLHKILEDTTGTYVPIDTMEHVDTTVMTIDIAQQEINIYPNPLNGFQLQITTNDIGEKINILGLYNQSGQNLPYTINGEYNTKTLSLSGNIPFTNIFVQYQYKDKIFIEKIVTFGIY